MFVPVHA